MTRALLSLKYLESSVRHFLDSAGRKLARSAASIDVSKIKEPSQYASRRSSSKALAAEESKEKSARRKESQKRLDGSEVGMFGRFGLAVLCHPLLSLSVKMLTDQTFVHRNWF